MVSESDPLAMGRAALGRAAWSQACLHFEEAVASSDAAEAWEGLSRAAWWQGDQDTTLSARERAYRAYREADDMCGAARMAMWLASDHLDFRGDDAVASAWLARGRALLGDQGACAESGFLTVLEADMALLAHSDPVTAASSGAVRRSTSRAASRMSVLRLSRSRSSAARWWRRARSRRA